MNGSHGGSSVGGCGCSCDSVLGCGGFCGGEGGSTVVVVVDRCGILVKGSYCGTRSSGGSCSCGCERVVAVCGCGGGCACYSGG